MDQLQKVIVLSACITFCMAQGPQYQYSINDGTEATTSQKSATLLSQQYQQRPQFQQNTNYIQKSQPTSQVSQSNPQVQYVQRPQQPSQILQPNPQVQYVQRPQQSSQVPQPNPQVQYVQRPQQSSQILQPNPQVQYVQRSQQPTQTAQRQQVVYNSNPLPTPNGAQFPSQVQPLSSQQINVPNEQDSFQSALNSLPHQYQHTRPQQSSQFYAQNDQPIEKSVSNPAQYLEYSALESSSPTPVVHSRPQIAIRPSSRFTLQNPNTQQKTNTQASEQTNFQQNILSSKIESDHAQLTDSSSRFQPQEQISVRKVLKQKSSPVQNRVLVADQEEISKKEYDEELIKEQNAAAKYSFSSQVNDDIQDGSLQRQEVRDGLALKGMYSYSDGFFKRTVEYEADENGYRIVNESSEPIGEGPAINPNGKADIATSFDGNNHAYSITADDIVDFKKKTKTPLQIGASQ